MSSLLFSGHLPSDNIFFCKTHHFLAAIIRICREHGQLIANFSDTISDYQKLSNDGDIPRVWTVIITAILCNNFMLVCCLVQTLGRYDIAIVTFCHSSSQVLVDSSHSSHLTVLKAIWWHHTSTSGQPVDCLASWSTNSFPLIPM